MQKSRSLQGIAEHEGPTSFSNTFDVADMPVPEAMRQVPEPTKRGRPTHSKSYSMTALRQESKPLFGEVTDDSSELDVQPAHILESSKAEHSPTRPALSPRRMSISDLNLEPGISASIEETNVTLDDIAQFIEGPDPDDNKWICKYEDCNKKFGRKENIKSHVQTHLGDRQFRCNHCDKCFVRGHDLKRHAKIHTGTKAYACLCGNAFARHDALTRHRQRGMCIGAFEGVVRKEIKRGRPRKYRPEMDERLDKATRTRRHKTDGKGHESQNDTYASSASSCSMSSWDSPPTETMDNLSIHDGPSSPCYDDGMNLFGMSANGLDMQISMNMTSGLNNMDQIALPPDMFSFTPPASPGFSTGNKPSPSYRELTPEEIITITSMQSEIVASGQPMQMHARAMNQADMPLTPTTTSAEPVSNSLQLPSSIAAEMTLQGSQHSLPSLSASHSSSPPPTDALAFDFGSDDPSASFRTSTMSNMSFGLSNGSGYNSNSMNMKIDDRNDFDNFLDYGNMSLDAGNSNVDNFFTGL